MKLSEYLFFAALLIPTVVVAVAALLSVATPDPDPEYRAPAAALASVHDFK